MELKTQPAPTADSLAKVLASLGFNHPLFGLNEYSIVVWICSLATSIHIKTRPPETPLLGQLKQISKPVRLIYQVN